MTTLMQTANNSTRIPPRTPPYVDWIINANRKAAPHNGATDSFQFIFQTPKYVEAYAALTGPGYGGWITYLNYNHGNQPYDAIDSGINTAFRTPTLPNWYSLAKPVPKVSAADIQRAQTQLSNMLQAKTPPGTLFAFGTSVQYP